MQNVVAVSHTVCTHVGGPKHLWDAGACPLGMGTADRTHVTTPNSAILCQTIQV